MWLLAVSYGIHLLATAVWLVSIGLLAFLAWDTWRQGSIAAAPWWRVQRRVLLWGNSSLVLLLLTGFYQMSSDTHYAGFLAIEGVWAWAMLFKHIAYVGVVAVGAYQQFWLHPALERLRLLAEKRPLLAKTEQQRLIQQEKRLLWLNVGGVAAVLLFTAVATAV